jgi:hypothetical protein
MLFHESASNRSASPPIAAEVDEHPDEPGFLVRAAGREGPPRLRRSHKRVLDQVAGLIPGGNEAPCQMIEPLMVNMGLF